jgi:hypothetical protein
MCLRNCPKIQHRVVHWFNRLWYNRYVVIHAGMFDNLRPNRAFQAVMKDGFGAGQNIAATKLFHPGTPQDI